jgi:hypothetical protein
MTHRDKLLAWFGTRKTITPMEAARTMALAGVNKRRAKIRAVCDDMRARMGMPKAEWPN